MTGNWVHPTFAPPPPTLPHYGTFPPYRYGMPPQNPRDIPPQVKLVSPKPGNPPGIPDPVNNQPVAHIPVPDVLTIGGDHPVPVPHPQPVDRDQDAPRGQQRSRPATKSRQQGKTSEKEVLPCLVRNCDKTFHRSDSLNNHLRTKHNIPIPRGCWAKVWVSKVENKPFYSAAVKAQAYANKIRSPRTE